MGYRIAVASSDGVNIDRGFKDTEKFIIYETDNEGGYFYVSERFMGAVTSPDGNATVSSAGCDGSSGMGCCQGEDSVHPGTGCGGKNSPKVLLVEDCRCVLSLNFGFGIQKKLSRMAISVFDVDGKIDTALRRLIEYYDRLDNHRSLRGM